MTFSFLPCLLPSFFLFFFLLFQLFQHLQGLVYGCLSILEHVNRVFENFQTEYYFTVRLLRKAIRICCNLSSLCPSVHYRTLMAGIPCPLLWTFQPRGWASPPPEAPPHIMLMFSELSIPHPLFSLSPPSLPPFAFSLSLHAQACFFSSLSFPSVSFPRATSLAPVFFWDQWICLRATLQ